MIRMAKLREIDCTTPATGRPSSAGVIFLVVGLGFQPAWPVLAQQVSEELAKGTPPSANLEAVTVTATRVEQPSFDTPASVDVIGIDPIPDEDLPIHKKLFREHEIVNIENLKDLDKCGDDLFWFFALPLKWENADGAPIRAVAFWE